MPQLMKPVPQTWLKVGSKETSGEEIPQRETKTGKWKLIVCKLQVSEWN